MRSLTVFGIFLTFLTIFVVSQASDIEIPKCLYDFITVNDTEDQAISGDCFTNTGDYNHECYTRALEVLGEQLDEIDEDLLDKTNSLLLIEGLENLFKHLSENYLTQNQRKILILGVKNAVSNLDQEIDFLKSLIYDSTGDTSFFIRLKDSWITSEPISERHGTGKSKDDSSNPGARSYLPRSSSIITTNIKESINTLKLNVPMNAVTGGKWKVKLIWTLVGVFIIVMLAAGGYFVYFRFFRSSS